MSIKSLKRKFRRKKICVSFSCPKDHSIKKLGSLAKRCVLQPVHTQTDTHTDRVTTKGTLSGFQDFLVTFWWMNSKFNLITKILLVELTRGFSSMKPYSNDILQLERSIPPSPLLAVVMTLISLRKKIHVQVQKHYILQFLIYVI